jgi:hypothetical protein
VITTAVTADGALTIDNRPADGNFSFNLEATVTEETGTPSGGNGQAVSFSGSRLVSPDLLDADNACIAKMFDQLRTQQPSEADMAAAIMAQLGHPPDPLRDPDPQLQWDGWQDITVTPATSGDAGDVGDIEINGLSVAAAASRLDIIVQQPPTRVNIDPGLTEIRQGEVIDGSG